MCCLTKRNMTTHIIVALPHGGHPLQDTYSPPCFFVWYYTSPGSSSHHTRLTAADAGDKVTSPFDEQPLPVWHSYQGYYSASSMRLWCNYQTGREADRTAATGWNYAVIKRQLISGSTETDRILSPCVLLLSLPSNPSATTAQCTVKCLSCMARILETAVQVDRH